MAKLSGDFSQQVRHLCTVARPSCGQLRCQNIACVGVDDQIQLTPLTPVAFVSGCATPVNLQTGAVDENVNRILGADRT